MRFMIIRKADKSTEAGVMPTQELLAAMGAYMEELGKAGRWPEARAELERAASLTRNARERRLLVDRAAECARVSASRPA